MSQLWRISVQRLGRDLCEASELASVLQEVAPDLQVDGLSPAPASRPCSSSGTGTPVTARDRVQRAAPVEIGPSCVRWPSLRAALSSESLQDPGASLSADGGRPQLLEVNTGGSVFFLLFGPDARRSRLGGAPDGNAGGCDGPSTTSAGEGPPEEAAAAPEGVAGVEGVAVLKVAGSRLAMQAEQFANELARHLGVPAPACRLVRQGRDGGGEWAAARAAAEALGEGGDELAGELGRMPCFLLMEFVAGRPLLGADDALAGPPTDVLLEDVGRLLLLDMLLGNADRLPLPELGWRGNRNNVLLGAAGSKHAGRAVAIDSCVARRPPALKSCAEDAAVERLAQLVLRAPDVAAAVAGQMLGPGAIGAAGAAAGSVSGSGGGGAPDVAAAVAGQMLGPGAAGAAVAHDSGGSSGGGVATFQRGFGETLARVLRIKGLLEMMQAHTAEWTAEFFEDLQQLLPGGLPRGPQGAAPPPLGELAAGMRTPSHLSPRPGSVGSASARASPRTSFHNRELPGLNGCFGTGNGAGGGSGGVGGGGGNGGGGGGVGGGSLSPGPPRANSLVRGSRSFTLGARAHSGALAAGAAAVATAAAGCPQSPRGGGGGGGGEQPSPGRGLPPAGPDGTVPVSAARAAAARCAAQRTLFSTPGGAGEPGAPPPPQLQAPPHAQPAARGPAGAGATEAGPPRAAAAAAAMRRASCDDAVRRVTSLTLSPQRSPRDALEARASGAGGASLSQAVSSALAGIAAEARHDEALAERVAAWKDRFRERAATLAGAISAWQARQSLERVLTTGFLDGSHPLVDAYELSVRLEHMLRRLGALQSAATAEAPVMVAPRLFLGGAVAADSHHLLAHIGVTHVLNATNELLLPPPSAGFEVMRVALSDSDSEDIAFHFDKVRRWIDGALAGGGGVLVHCHEGRSRSVTLVAAYLMAAHGLDLATALGRIRAVRPTACPNAGFMAALVELQAALGGGRDPPVLDSSLCKRGKPAPRLCPLCGDAAGVSSESLAVHMRARHRGRAAGELGG